jgi:hypothetical protein
MIGADLRLPAGQVDCQNRSIQEGRIQPQCLRANPDVSQILLKLDETDWDVERGAIQ